MLKKKSSLLPLTARTWAKRSALALAWLLWSTSAGALPIDLSPGATLTARAGGKTVFEVQSLTDSQLEALRKWLLSPGDDVNLKVSGSEIVGAPVPLRVTPEIARSWKSDAGSLARLFAERLEKAVDGLPGWSVAGQLVPLSESREVSVSPLPEGALELAVGDPEIARVEHLGQGRIRVSGLKPGQTTLSVRGSDLPPLPIQVKPWAARWGQGPEKLDFWGAVGRERIEESLSRWLSARTLLGASTQLSPVKSEQEGVVKYLARAEAPGALPVEATMEIRVVKHPAELQPTAQTLLLSNHPEKIFEEGILFSREASGPNFRFMWHHRNDPEGPERYLIVQVENPTPAPRRFRLLWKSYGPSPDEIHVGHTAAFDYVMAARAGQTESFVLPPNASRTMEIRRVKPGQTMSGMAYLRDESGSQAPLHFKVLAADSDGPLPTREAVSRDPGRTASGVFPGQVETQETHTLGGPFTYIEYGGEPYVTDREKGHPSYGNFGTVYRTRLTLFNPSDQDKTALIGFASAGGAARGVLRVDETIYNMPMGRTGNGIDVCSYLVPAGETVQVDLELFPQAGSNYPIRVVVRSDFERREKVDSPPPHPLRPLIP